MPELATAPATAPAPASAPAPTTVTTPALSIASVIAPVVAAVETLAPTHQPISAEPEMVTEKEVMLSSEAEPEAPIVAVETETKAEVKMITQSLSFKEETNVVADLPESQKKALDELKELVQEALNKHELLVPSPPPQKEEEKAPEPTKQIEAKKEEEVEVKIDEVVEAKTEEEVAVVEIKKEEHNKVIDVVEGDVSKTVEAIKETIMSVVAEPEIAIETLPPLSPEEVSIWGIPLLQDERSDTVLLKFLRAKDFKAKEALTMLKNTVRWRKEIDIDSLDDTENNQWSKIVFLHGQDKKEHIVCYNVYSELNNKELLTENEKRAEFLKWRIQLLERTVKKLDFSPTGVNSIVYVNDLKSCPGIGKTIFKQVIKQDLQIQEYYPDCIVKQVFINVPWWFVTYYWMISPYTTQRTKSKMVFAGLSRSTETLFKYIDIDQVPVKYGGLSRDGEQEFTNADPITEITINPTTIHTVEFPVSEGNILAWELRVLGLEVSYGAQFEPSSESSYTVIVSKTRKLGLNDEPLISDSFKINEAGKVVLTIDNQTSKKKKLMYRSKSKPLHL